MGTWNLSCDRPNEIFYDQSVFRSMHIRKWWVHLKDKIYANDTRKQGVKEKISNWRANV